MDIKLKVLTIAELEDFVNSEEFESMANIPISKHRAESYRKNPRAIPTDKVLYLAYDGSTLVGYRLILPDYLLKDKQFLRIGWFSCVWTHPLFRRKGIADVLVKAALEDWGGRILLNNPVPSSKALSLKNNLSELKLEGIRLYFRFNLQTILLSRKKDWFISSAFSGLADSILNLINDPIRQLRLKKFTDSNISIEIVDSLIEKDVQFIENCTAENWFKRSLPEFKWIGQYPWVLSGNKADRDSQRYFFSAYDRLFKQVYVRVVDKQTNNEAILMLKQRNEGLEMPYIWNNGIEVERIMQVIYAYMLNHKIDTFSTFQQEYVQYLNGNPSPSIFQKKIEKSILFGHEIESIFGKAEPQFFQDGDGDSVFT